MTSDVGKARAARRAMRWYVRYPRAAPIGLFLVLLAISIMSVYAIERSEDSRLQAQTRQTAEALGSSIEAQALTATAYLRAGAAFVDAHDELESDAFGEFFREMREEARYRGVVGVGWAPQILAGEVPLVLDIERENGQEDIGTSDNRARAERDMVPIRLISPSTLGNRALIGYDLSSEPALSAALEEAESSGRTTASAPLDLGNAPRQSLRTGFFIVMPVFTEAQGYRDLRGFVFSPFEAREFLENAIENEELEMIAVDLTDETDGASLMLAQAGTIEGERDPRVAMRSISVGGREWVLRVSAPGDKPLSNLSLATLLFGLLASILILAIVHLLTRQAREDSDTLVWLEQQNAIRDTLTRELNHRVKNTLANVLSIIALTRRRADKIEDFADSLSGRIRALSATHDLLTQSEWSTTPIGAVLDAEITPYRQDSGQQITLEGPDVMLAPNDALSLGLAIHELATNAAKYGSLSVDDGKLEVRWHLVSENLAQLEWKEAGGPPVPKTRKRGFGTELIRKIVAHELRHPVDLEFDEDGVQCTLRVPVRPYSDFELRSAK